MAFSIAAPIGAILSYLILSGVSSLGRNDPTASNESWVGLILLFSVSLTLYHSPIPSNLLLVDESLFSNTLGWKFPLRCYRPFPTVPAILYTFGLS